MENQIVDNFVLSGKWLVVSNTIQYITNILKNNSIHIDDQIKMIKQRIEYINDNNYQYVATQNNQYQYLSNFNELKIASYHLHQKVLEDIRDIEEQLSIDVEEMI